MRTLVLIAALSLPLAAADAQLRVATRNTKPCTPSATLVAGKQPPPGVRKLGELPGAVEQCVREAGARIRLNGEHAAQTALTFPPGAATVIAETP